MAFSISFQRTFKHSPWVDRIDRVAAGGDNGFNVRFQALEADLDTIGARFTDVTNSLNALGQGVELERKVNVTPILTQAGTVGWDTTTTPGLAQKPVGAASAYGTVPVALPPGGRITAFRAVGTNTGSGTLRLDLTVQKLTGQGQTQVVRITVAGQPADQPFNIERIPSGGGIDVIDEGSSYFIFARLDNAGANDAVKLSGFQVVYRAR